MVHSLVGNDYDQFGRLVRAGWMGDFATAGLDPVFWLHHSNIDRLWQVWLEADAGHTNPTGDRAWMRTKFKFPKPGGGTFEWEIGDVLDTAALGYKYESVKAPTGLRLPEPPYLPAEEAWASGMASRPHRLRRKLSAQPSTCRWWAISAPTCHCPSRQTSGWRKRPPASACSCGSKASPGPSRRRPTTST